MVERTVRTPLGAALPAAAWSAVLGFAVVALLVVAGWLAAPDAGVSSGQVVTAGAQGWLLANFTDLGLPDGAIALTPLGLALIPGYVLYRSGGWAARAADVRDWADAARTTGLLSVIYGGVATTVAVLATGPAVRPYVPSALLGAGGLAVVAGGAGVLRGSGLARRSRGTVPAHVRAVGRAASAGVATVVCGGAVLLAGSLIAHFGQVSALWGSVHPDPVGAVLLVALSVALVPNAVLWAAAYCLGPGFAVGAGTAVAPTGVVVGAVPSLPVLGALPGAGDAPAASLVGLLVPVVAGVIVGAVVGRDRGLALSSPARTALIAAVAGVVAGLLLGVLAAIAGGGIGPGRMAVLGPSAWRVALVAALEIGAVAAATAWEWRRHAGRAGGTR